MVRAREHPLGRPGRPAPPSWPSWRWSRSSSWVLGRPGASEGADLAQVRSSPHRLAHVPPLRPGPEPRRSARRRPATPPSARRRPRHPGADPPAHPRPRRRRDRQGRRRPARRGHGHPGGARRASAGTGSAPPRPTPRATPSSPATSPPARTAPGRSRPCAGPSRGCGSSSPRADGTEHEYEVTGREAIVKKALPVDEIFARDGRPLLVLITCGGEYLPELRSHRDNVVVTAVPV